MSSDLAIISTSLESKMLSSHSPVLVINRKALFVWREVKGVRKKGEEAKERRRWNENWDRALISGLGSFFPLSAY